MKNLMNIFFQSCVIAETNENEFFSKQHICCSQTHEFPSKLPYTAYTRTFTHFILFHKSVLIRIIRLLSFLQQLKHLFSYGTVSLSLSRSTLSVIHELHCVVSRNASIWYLTCLMNFKTILN